MLILIDTSALHSDPTLNRPYGRLLLAATRSDEVDLVLPEIVVLEAVNMFRERLEQASRSIRKAQRELQSLGVGFAPELPDDASVGAYEQTLRGRLADAGARIPQPPNVAHLDLAVRAVAKRKPFDGKGRGYRDTLIWLHALEEARADDVVLVTANVNNFAGDDRVSLAPELAGDLEAAGLPRNRVRLADGLRAVVHEHVEPSVQALTRLTALLDEPAFKDQMLNAVTESLLYKEVEAPDDPDLRMLDVRDVQIDAVEEVRDIEIDEAYEDGDLLAFNVGGTLVAEADFYPFKYEIAGADVPEVTVHDWDWNESVVHASKTLEFGFEGFGAYDPAAGEVTSVDVWLAY
ncbi:MAG TPA: PIN domain-containing protein [Thermoanaerobaculia bacterium]|nr:PIN domain-containing protein [Thermoanaerobaculia bacterium]